MDYVDLGTNMTDSEYLEEVLGAQHMGLKVGNIVGVMGRAHGFKRGYQQSGRPSTWV